MRVIVVGATGNVGTALLRSLADESSVDSIVGLARRVPNASLAKVDWAAVDVETDALEPHFRGADAVVHLAWRIQPSRRLNELWATNVHGSNRVFDAVARAGVASLVYASSVGAYAPAPKDRLVDESWPVDGVPTSFYSRHKAEVERRLDRFEVEHPRTRVVRLRPALIFQRGSAYEQRRLFAGPLVPSPLLRRGVLPFVPAVRALRFQVVHAEDVANAYRLAIVSDARGAFNVAAEPVLEGDAFATALAARPIHLSPRLVRTAMAAAFRLHVQPSPPGWFDLGLRAPLLDSTRARNELAWAPQHDGERTLRELIDGIRDNAGAPTPPLDPEESGRLRRREVATLAGEREQM
ncbi:MAG TPA: NAD-dependent epimerase/dehydratase family protein [Gaiellaceae bacterium]|nr:NAD-dependent epimerase/dehydratase family protein [Gaiellaceae bacterium]